MVFKGSWKLHWRWCSRWTWSCLHFKGAARSLLCAEYSISCLSVHCVSKHCVRNVGFCSKRVFHCEAVSHSEFLPYSKHVLSVVNGAKTFVFKGSWKLRWRWCSRSTWSCLHFKGAARSLLCAAYSKAEFQRNVVFFPIANLHFEL